MFFSFFIFHRRPSFSYPCICKERCWKKDDILCLINKSTRNYCKRCRFNKCVQSAGMKREWVIEQYIPKVENSIKKKSVDKRYSHKDKTTGLTNASHGFVDTGEVIFIIILCSSQDRYYLYNQTI